MKQKCTGPRASGSRTASGGGGVKDPQGGDARRSRGSIKYLKYRVPLWCKNICKLAEWKIDVSPTCWLERSFLCASWPYVDMHPIILLRPAHVICFLSSFRSLATIPFTMTLRTTALVASMCGRVKSLAWCRAWCVSMRTLKPVCVRINL
jgi:hypothetical protein